MFLHTIKLILVHFLIGTKSNKSEKTKSIKDPNSEPSSLFQREGVHLLLGELSKKFPPQFLQQGQVLPGIIIHVHLWLVLAAKNAGSDWLSTGALFSCKAHRLITNYVKTNQNNR